MKKFCIGIDSNKKYFGEIHIIPIFPCGNLENGFSIEFPFLYEPAPKNFFESFQKKFQSNIINLIKSLNLNFNNSALHFCTDNISRHFSLQYSSAFYVAKKIAQSFDVEGVLVNESLSTISAGWISPVINLLAILDAYHEIGKEIKIIESRPGIISEITINGLQYLPYAALYKKLMEINFDDNLLFYLLENNENIRYSLTSRNQNFLNEMEFVDITSNHSSLNESQKKVSLSFQFLGIGNKSPVTDLKFYSQFLICTNPISLIFELSIYNIIINKIINPMVDIEVKFIEHINKNKRKINAYIEETVDIESLGLISALKKTESNVILTQHSFNPIVNVIKTHDGDFFPNLIISKNIYSHEIYKKICGNFVHVINDKNYFSEFCLNNDKPYILILDNEAISYFGISVNASDILCDLKIFIQSCIKNGYKKFIWRQRDFANASIFNFIRNEFKESDLEFIPNCLTPPNELSKLCLVSVGFGTTSSFSIDLIRAGVPYLFGSSSFSDYEYMPNVDFIFDNGPSISADHINKMFKNKNFYEDFLRKQLDILSLGYLSHFE